MEYDDKIKFEKTLDQVKTHLMEYLAERGIDTKSNFCCITPTHEDNSPSMGVVKGNPNVFNCFGCGSSGNIFHAVHWLEGKPIIGRDFITDNLNYLARKYGIDTIEFELSEQDIHEMSTRQIYTQMASILTKTGHNDLTNTRNWDEETCKALGVTTLDDYGEAVDSLISNLGFHNREEMFNAGLSPRLFGATRITFTLRDPYGRVIGFACRNMDYEEWKGRSDSGEKGIPQEKLRKFDYTAPHSGTFVKEKFIYNLDRARRTGGQVYIFEGQGSVITALQNDIKNVVASCGPFTKEMFREIRRHGINDIILAFDHDRNRTGQKRTSSVIKEVIGISSDARVRVLNWRPKLEELNIDEKSVDPDWFIQEFGVEQFKSIPLLSTFEWQIESLFDVELSPEEKAEQLVPIIMQEASLITQDRYGKQLAQYLDVDAETIMEYIKELRRAKDNDTLKRQNVTIKKFQRQFNALEDATKRMELTREFNDDMEKLKPNPTIITVDDDMIELDKIIDDINNEKAIAGLNIGLDELENRLNGKIDLPGLFWYIGAEPNTGKTALIQTLGIGMLQQTEIPVRILYFLNDDTKHEFTIRMWANMTRTSINAVKHLYRFEKGSKFRGLLENNIKIFKGWQSERKLRIFNDAFSLDTIMNNIRKELKDCKCPLIVFVDSFTRVDNVYSNERERVEYTSKKFKQIVNTWGTYGVSMICTSEVNKPSEISRRTNARSRPMPRDLKGSGKMEFDANLVTMLDNKMHRLPDHYINHQDAFWIPEGLDASVENHKPIIHLHFDKNKRSSFKRCVRLKLRPEISRMQSYDVGPANINIPIGERT